MRLNPRRVVQTGGRALITTVVVAAFACRSVNSSMPRSSASDDAEIRALLRGSTDAWNRGDLKGHLSIYSDSVTFMTANGPRVGVKPIEEAFARKYFNEGAPKQTLAFDEILIRHPAATVALVTGRFSLTGGGLADQSGHFTLIWRREGGRWAVIHDHSS